MTVLEKALECIFGKRENTFNTVLSMPLKGNFIIANTLCLSSFCSFHQCRQVKLFVPWINSLPNSQSFDWSKLTAFADDKIKVGFCLLIGLKTLWEKEKMLFTSIFSFSLNAFYSGSLKVWILNC